MGVSVNPDKLKLHRKKVTFMGHARMSSGLGHKSKKLPFKAFQEITKLVTQAPIFSYYDPSSDLVIHCDASRKGLGAALLQDLKPVAYASRAFTETETCYAQMEKEMLAIVYALEKFNQFTFGRHVTMITATTNPLRGS